MDEVENFLGENILSRRHPIEVVDGKEASQLERNVSLLARIGVRRDGLELPCVEFFSALLIVHLEAFKLVARHRLNVVFLVVLNVLLQSLESLARSEQIADRCIDGKVGGRDSENLVAELHASEGMVHEEVAAHELVHEEFSD